MFSHEISSGSEIPTKLHIVVIQEDDRDRFFQGFPGLEDPLDNLLTARVFRMRFTCKNNLKWAQRALRSAANGRDHSKSDRRVCSQSRAERNLS